MIYKLGERSINSKELREELLLKVSVVPTKELSIKLADATNANSNIIARIKEAYTSNEVL